jgi:glycosyltransferase involved in cell wall biosynthesis
MFYAPKSLVHRGRGIKGHDVVLAAWAKFLDNGGRGRLVLVGGGFGLGGSEYRDAVRAQANSTGIQGVTWVDTVDDVRRYYYAADVSVSPSRSENLGAPAEASALGIPSIASAVGGIPELVVDGWNGWLVRPGDPQDLADALVDASGCGTAELLLRGARARARAREILDLGACQSAFVDTIERVGGERR